MIFNLIFYAFFSTQKFERFFSAFFACFLRGLRMCLHARKPCYIMTIKMNKNIRLLFLSPLLFDCLTGCHAGKYNLTLGTYLNCDLNSLTVVDGNQLEDLSYRGDTFLVATYQKNYSIGCYCWDTFQNIIVNYTNTYHEKVYVFDTTDADSFITHGLKIKEYEDSTPALYICRGGRCLASFSSKDNRNKAIFEDTTAKAMYERVHKTVDKPIMFEVDNQYLDENLNKREDTILFFMRNGCGDCSYVIPNVLIPYISENKREKEILLYDLQGAYDLSKDETASEEEKGQYQALKDKYGLSEKGNQKYGYLNGVVPTFQHYKNGEIDDATVFFNDVVSEKEDGTYYLSDSYYSEERIKNLSYYNGEPLKGMAVTGVLKTKDNYPYWSQNEAAKYHTPILRLFLDYYLL